MTFASAHPWPKTTGAYAVGCLEFELTDRDRGTFFTPTPDIGRRFRVFAWYPAQLQETAKRRPYFTEQEAEHWGRAVLEGTYGLPERVLQHCTRVATNSVPRAPMPLGDDKFPLLVFNHAAPPMYPTQNTALMEELASHGYVVLSMTHPNETGTIFFEDGSIAHFDGHSINREKFFETAKLLPELYFAERMSERLEVAGKLMRGYRKIHLSWLGSTWRDDTLFVVDQVESGAVPDAVKFLTSRTDTSRVGYFGMSYGAWVSALLAQADHRCVAAWNLDGGFFTYEFVDTEIRTPFLQLMHDPLPMHLARTGGMKAMLDPASCNRDDVPLVTGLSPSYADLSYERLDRSDNRADVYRFILPGVFHIGMCDLPIILPAEFHHILGYGPVLGPRWIEIQNRLGLAFFDSHVRGRRLDLVVEMARACPELVRQDRHAIIDRNRKSG